jgi:hypothetical protein
MKKSHITPERLYSEERKGRRASEITKEVSDMSAVRKRETKASEKSTKQFQTVC